jgi:outer membrane autotransporter protein
VSLQTTTVPSTVDAPATLITNNAAITNTTNPNGPDQSALIVQAGGSATIGTALDPVSGVINMSGAGSTNVIWAIVFTDPTFPGSRPVASVTYDGLGITATGGPNSTLIQACANDGCQLFNTGDGDAKIDAAGNLTGVGGGTTPTNPNGMNGLFAAAGGQGDATVNYHRGTIDITQSDTGIAAGIFASSSDVGSATIRTDSGTTVMVSSGLSSAVFGIDAFASGGNATADVASTILIDGSSTAASTYRRNPTGIIVTTDPTFTPGLIIGSASVTYSGPGITVHGGSGLGIVAVAGSVDETTKSGSVTVSATGPIVADGSNAVGILADSGTIRNVFRGSPSPPTTMTGLVNVTANNVSTPGEFGTAISATGGSGGVTVNVPSGGSIMGGWQPDVTSVGSTYGLPATGVILGSSNSSVGTATLTNNGTIGALSDRAIASPLPSFFAKPSFPSFPTSNNTSIINNGTITGFVQLTGDNNSIVNNGTFNLRHFADTTGATDASGNGVRDTVRVAVADLGAGANATAFPNNTTFKNNGTLALVPATGATRLDNGGQYLPLNNLNNGMALNGPLQGQLLGVSTFTNSGTIDLQSNPAAGDVLVISGSQFRVVPTASVAAANFPGTYVSNGGTLKLDTVLNEGGTATRSDTLVVDGTSVLGGATKTSILNAGGKGALTVGDGILVVQVLDPTRSAAGAFTLANQTQEIDVGLVTYKLYQGGVLGRNPGDWFLRSDIVPTTPTTPPTTPTTPPTTPTTPTTPPSDTDPPISTAPPSDVLPTTPPSEPLPATGTFPIIGPRIATYSVVQPIARELGLAMLGTMHERIGDTLTVENADPYAEGWGQSSWVRFFGEQVNKRYQSFADPTATGRELGVQAGFDIWRGSFIPGHHDAAGVYFAYGNGKVDVNGLVTNPAGTAYVFSNTGNLNLQAYSGGAYWTHYGPGGWYLDAILQGTAYTGDATTVVSKLPTDGSGFIASLEGGYPIPLPLGPNFKLEPQAQIIYQHVGFHDAFDNEATIGLGTTSGATGRLGVRGQWTINTESGRVWQPYVRANVWHNWGAQSSLTSPQSALTVPLLENTTWLEFAGGLTVKMNANFSAYVQFGGEFAVAPSNAKYNGVKGDIGVRWTFGQPPPPLPAPAPVAAPARSYLVFFDWDKATLTDRARQIIRQAADNSNKVQYTRIEVNGYTDTSGTPKYNQGLSIRRAQAVEAELIKDGVPANVITIQGFGETHLLVQTGPGVREPQNRRVEIIIH